MSYKEMQKQLKHTTLLAILMIAIVVATVGATVTVYTETLAGMGRLTITGEVQITKMEITGTNSDQLKVTMVSTVTKTFTVHLYLDGNFETSQTISLTADTPNSLTFLALNFTEVFGITVKVTQ